MNHTMKLTRRVKVKYLFMVMLLYLLSSCSSTETTGEDDWDIEGVTLYYYQHGHSGTGQAVVFVEDNLFGNYIKSIYNDRVPDDYASEAYRILISDETKVYNSGTGEEIDQNSEDLHHITFRGGRASVKVQEDFEATRIERGIYRLQPKLNSNLYSRRDSTITSE